MSETSTPTRSIFGRGGGVEKGAATIVVGVGGDAKSSITSSTLTTTTTTTTSHKPPPPPPVKKNASLMIKEHIKQRNVRRKSSTIQTTGCFAHSSSCGAQQQQHVNNDVELLRKAAKRGSIHFDHSDPKQLRQRLLMLQQKQQAFAHVAHNQLGISGGKGVRKKAFAVAVDPASSSSTHYLSTTDAYDDVEVVSSLDLDLPSLSHAISSLVSPNHSVGPLSIKR